MNKNLYYKDALQIERQHNQALAAELAKANAMIATLGCCALYSVALVALSWAVL